MNSYIYCLSRYSSRNVRRFWKYLGHILENLRDNLIFDGDVDCKQAFIFSCDASKSIISNGLSNNMAVFTDISAYNDSFSSNDYLNIASHNCVYTES